MSVMVMPNIAQTIVFIHKIVGINHHMHKRTSERRRNGAEKKPPEF